ncbi:MAG TPA: carboxypeptidase-like regulatory domain-containing protein [Herpetosiphonaceae bacterium]
MIRPYIRALLVRTGLFVMIGLALQIVIASPARAQTPPRPTIEPTVTPTPTSVPVSTPTATTVPTAPPKDDEPDPTDTPAGRIIGTVIDLTTNAPARGITVAIGDATVTTDANGNYQSAELAAGSYRVALVLTAAQGTPAQEPIVIALAAGQTVTQHLAFRSPIAATATALPTATAPAAPTTIPPTAVPTSRPTAPVTLPDTGSSAQQTSLSTGVVGMIVLLLGVSIWGLTERSRRRAVKARSR